MSLIYLEILRFRNLREVKIKPSQTVNIITGDNAAGKTSILEALYFLSVSRSFRTHRIKDVIKQDKENFQVIAQINSGNHQVRLGIEKGNKHTRLRKNGESVKQASELAAFLPVQLIHPQGHQLLEQGPKERRKFLDWGVFHVEQEFLANWHKFSRILKQRNAAIRLKSDKASIRLWDQGFTDAAIKITEFRKWYLDNLQPYISKYCDFLIAEPVTVNFNPGWNQELTLEENLQKQIDMDAGIGKRNLPVGHHDMPQFCGCGF